MEEKNTALTDENENLKEKIDELEEQVANLTAENSESKKFAVHLETKNE